MMFTIPRAGECGACLVSTPFWSVESQRWIHPSGVHCGNMTWDDGSPVGACCLGHKDGDIPQAENCVTADERE